MVLYTFMPYKIGKWTTSTIDVLKFIDDKNKVNINPRAKDLPSGTYRNWVYPLKDAGYVEDKEGFVLTERGKSLLANLIANPPVSRRGRIKGNKRSTQINVQATGGTPLFEVSIQGTDTVYHALVDSELANEIIATISNLRKKKK